MIVPCMAFRSSVRTCVIISAYILMDVVRVSAEEGSFDLGYSAGNNRDRIQGVRLAFPLI